MPAKLALGELRRLARLVQAGLLALDDASVTREEALALERDAYLRIRLDERARDTVPDRSGLPRGATARHANAQVVGRRGFGNLERRENHLAMESAREILVERAAVDPCLAVARSQDHAGDRCLPLARSEVL